MNPVDKALQAQKALRPEPGGYLRGSRIFSCDYQALRELLVLAACPIVCVGHVNDTGWHNECIAKAEAALEALGVADV